MFYLAVLQAVLLFGSNMWVLTPRLEKSLEGFLHQLVQSMLGMGPKLQQGGTWVYPLIGVALEIVRLDDIGVYISRLQNMVTQYIATLPIMDLCLEEERKPGMRLSSKWWEQPALDILGIRAGHAAT